MRINIYKEFNNNNKLTTEHCDLLCLSFICLK